MRRRILWTPDERDIICERIAEIIRETPDGQKYGGRLFKQAQDVLDETRRRKFFSSNKEDRLLLAEARKRATIQKTRIEQTRPAEPFYIPVPTPLAVSDCTTHELLAEVILRFSEWFRSPAPLPLSLPSGVKASPLVTPSLREPAKPKLRRIGVVGLLKDQYNHLKERINGGKLELVWLDKDKGSEFPPSLDYVLVQRHSSHAHYDQAKESVGNERVRFINGGISECAAQLAEWFPGCLN